MGAYVHSIANNGGVTFGTVAFDANPDCRIVSQYYVAPNDGRVTHH